MWSDNDIDNAFQRLNPPEPEPMPFPLDAWLRLETQLDKAVIERAVRRRVWRLFAAEVGVMLLAIVGWLLWPAGATAPTKAVTALQKTEAAQEANSVRPATAASTSAAAPPRHATAQPAAGAAASAASAAPAGPLALAGAAVADPAASARASTPVEPPHAQVKGPLARPLFTAITPRRQPTRLRESQREKGENALPLNSLVEVGTAAVSRKLLHRTEASAAYAGRRATGTRAFSAAAANGTMPEETASNEPAKSQLASRRAAGAARRQWGIAGQARRQEQAGRAAAAAETTKEALALAPATGNAAAQVGQSARALEPTTALAPGPVLLAPVAPANLPAPLATVAVAAPLPAPQMPLPAAQPRFYIGLVGAPDVTTVRFASVESPLPNVGITLEYRLSNRLRVSTGVLRSKKQYMARRDDYDWGAYKNQVYKHDFEDVDGTCTVLDVPLNLRYDLLIRPQYRLFGSLGLSSYFMQREHYTYDYQEGSMYKLWDGGEIINQNRHLLSIFNLSVGYERSLSPRWSLQAEPYLKMPLAGVGAGKVKLTSAGVFLGVKYGF